MSVASSSVRPTAERSQELAESLHQIRSKVASSSRGRSTLLVAVSKYKPASDVLGCYEHDQRDFGENYVQELVDKAKQLPEEIRWHFIGTLQSNKAKVLASIPNLYAIQTLSSLKAADALNRALPVERDSNPLNVLLQVNTSGEESKSGLPPLDFEEALEDEAAEPPALGSDGKQSDLLSLAMHIIRKCPRLHLQGLMTIGSLAESLATDTSPNRDFRRLVATRAKLEKLLTGDPEINSGALNWGENGHLLLSMGMSSDYEAALQEGSDIVRVGTGIFGARPQKN